MDREEGRTEIPGKPGGTTVEIIELLGINRARVKARRIF